MNGRTDTYTQQTEHADLVVVGGGLAGLTAAALASRAGQSVIVLERASAIGGRAATQVRSGVHFNLGAHALYLGGSAKRILDDLSVPYSGGLPPVGNAILTVGRRLYRMPTTARSLLTTRVLSPFSKIRLINFLRRLPTINTRPLDDVSLGDWLRDQRITGHLNAVLQVLFRVSTYVSDPAVMSAGAAIDQVKIGLAGVLYLNGGWQTLIDGLRTVAEANGAVVKSSLPVVSVQSDGRHVRIETGDGRAISAKAAVLAVAPTAAANLLGESAFGLSDWAAKAEPVRVACLDIALAKLPVPARSYAMGLDRPLYYSVHSASAKLAAPGTAVVHLMKYLPNDEHPDSAAVRAELEGYLDRIQPGWRQHVIEERYLPSMIAANALAIPEQGGLFGRPSVVGTEHSNIFLAGDWVGCDGMLADAAMASAETAVTKFLQKLSGVSNREQFSVAG